MELSTLTIRELFAELTAVEDALHGRTEQGLTASRRRMLEHQQDRICQELRSRSPVEVLPPAAAGSEPAGVTIPV